MVCSGPITYKGQEALQTDIENLRSALQGVHVEEAFMPASSPTNIESQRQNEYYPTPRRISTPSPMPCARSTGALWMPDSFCRSMTHDW